jgi:hypothetical protein
MGVLPGAAAEYVKLLLLMTLHPHLIPPPSRGRRSDEEHWRKSLIANG